MTASAQILLSSDLIKVSDFTCNTPKSGCGCELCDGPSSITVVRRGVHAYHGRGRVALAEAGLAILYRGGEVYRLSHPYHRDAPDRSTCIEFDDGILGEAFGDKPLDQDLGTHLAADTQLHNLQLLATLACGTLDIAAAEEAVLFFIHAIVKDFKLARNERASPKREGVGRNG